MKKKMKNRDRQSKVGFAIHTEEILFVLDSVSKSTTTITCINIERKAKANEK